MAFIDQRFPDTLALGASGGPRFVTDIAAVQGGGEYRNQAVKHPRWAYQVGQVHRSYEETLVLLQFFRAVARGTLHTFRFRDPAPGQASVDHGVLGTGDGEQRFFQLSKRYQYGAAVYDRPIRRPVLETLTVFLDGVALAPTAYLVDSAGLLTLIERPAAGVVVSASFAFDLEMRFTSDHLPMQRVAPRVFSWQSIELLEERFHGDNGLQRWTEYWEFTDDLSHV